MNSILKFKRQILLIAIISLQNFAISSYAQSPDHLNSDTSKSNFRMVFDKTYENFVAVLSEEETKMPPLYEPIIAVQSNLNNLKSLLQNSLQNSKPFEIDFIPQYEINGNVQIGQETHDSIERYQKAVKEYLSFKKYDLIGWEASALDSVTRETLEQELINNWKDADPSVQINATGLFYRFASKYMWQDGVLAYFAGNPKARLTGLQETSTWKLNLKANEFDVPFSYYVTEFRSYIAMAKMLKAIRITKAIHPVIVMGAWHQYDLTSIANLLGIKINVVNVMEKR